jgi:hypothetical protein
LVFIHIVIGIVLFILDGLGPQFELNPARRELVRLAIVEFDIPHSVRAPLRLLNNFSVDGICVLST